MTALELWNRLRDRLRRPELVAELEAELRFHQSMLARDNEARGVSPEVALRLARVQLGNRTYLTEETRARWSLGWVDDVIRDARYALRTLSRAPVFVAVALLCLALGIGANAAIFTVINGVLLRPLPYADPSRIVQLFEWFPERGANWTGSVSWANFHDWQTESTDFSAMAAYVDGSANLQDTGDAQRLRTVAATADYFRVFGVQPLIGRVFAPEEDSAGRNRVVILGEGFWRSRFAADPRAVGRTVTLDNQAYSVIGVMPDSFSRSVEAWIPLDVSPAMADSRGNHFLHVAARLRPGVSVSEAAAQMRQIADRIAERFPKEQAGRSAAVESMSDRSTRGVRPALLVLMGAVALVLLIACANVANLLLARAAARQQEVSVRLALGAGRARLIRQFLVESLMLSIVGTILGALLARFALGSLVKLAADSFSFPARIQLDGHVVVFLAIVSIASGVLFGLAPAAQLAGIGAGGRLGGAGRRTASSAQQRLRSGLVVGEIALSVVLLIGAVLLIRGFVLLLDSNSGLDPRNVLTAHLSIPKRGYDAASIAPKLLSPVVERVRAIPGVEAAGIISILPIQDAWTNGGFYVPGEPLPEPGSEPFAEYRYASDGVYHALGVPLLAGRDFNSNDGVGERVAVINQALAQNHFHGVSPVGRTILTGGPDGVPRTIIGVVGDVRQAGLDRDPLEEIDLPYRDTLYVGVPGDAVLVMKTRSPSANILMEVREAVRSVAAGQPVYRVMTMQQVMDDSLTNRRLNLVLLLVFAGVALALSAAGLYGVISYLVTQRTQEIGIRIALGARGRQVVRLMLRQGVILSGIGLVLGLAGAAALSSVLRRLLYGVSATDPATYLVVALLLAAIAMLATWIPARRAARVNPVIAMKAD